MFLQSFSTHFQERYKELGFTQETLAEKLGISRDAVAKYTCFGGNTPSLERLEKITQVLKCDLGYLFGEIDTPTYKEQTIVDSTGLNEKTAAKLSNLSIFEMRAIDALFSHEQIDRFLLLISDYMHSQNSQISVKMIDGKNRPAYSEEEQRQMFKYTVTDTFSRILDDLYFEREEEAKQEKIGLIIAELAKDIDSISNILDKQSTRKTMLERIRFRQEQIKELDAENIFCKIQPSYVLEHYKDFL